MSTEQKKAIVTKHPVRLIVPQYGKAPMLFMEWLSNQWDACIEDITHSFNEDFFRVKLDGNRELHEAAAGYINRNL